MKMFWKGFFRRGLLFAWLGPVVLSVVYFFLQRAGVVSVVTVDALIRAVLSSTLMAFIAAGISCVYQAERIPFATASILHAITLYLDYLLFYLLNGWLPTAKIWVFSAIFIAGFLLIWLIIYFVAVRRSVKQLNEKLRT